MPAEIKNLKKVAQRILKAAKFQEKIILYGDADLDGVTSVIILEETLKNLGSQVAAIYFPNREKEGYGVNEKALQFLQKYAPALFLALDCGIGNFKEINQAKKLGFEVIIIDHHEILDKLPAASIIVDPKQKGDKYPFKGLATAGIIFKLSQFILKNKLTDSLKKNFLELVALATIADTMPEEDENKIFIEEGLASLENSWRPGLRAFLKINTIRNQGTIRQTAQKIISALNAMDATHPPPRKDHLNQAFLLLTTGSSEEAEVLANDLLEKRYRKQIRIREITEEVEENVLKKLTTPIIFEGNSNWSLVLLGSVASKICHVYKKPTFIFKKGRIENRGAVRTPSGIDGVEAMKKCSKLLKTYGGHPQAAGFTIKNENSEKFKECLIKHFKK